MTEAADKPHQLKPDCGEGTEPSTVVLEPSEHRQAMRDVILGQCAGMLSMNSLRNNLVLLYLLALGLQASWVLTLLSVVLLVQGLMMSPASFLCENYGKKVVGYVGQAFMILGFCTMMFAALLDVGTAFWVVMFGLIAFGAGGAMVGGGWFALLQPIVPESQRGRFFGNMRLSWQTVTLIFTGAVAVFLGARASIWQFQIFLGIALLGLIVRLYFYRRIPEVEPAGTERVGILEPLNLIRSHSKFVSFCAYVFLLLLFSHATLWLFGLIEKEVIQMGDNRVIWMANLTLVGSLVGFFMAGRIVDRFGTRAVFLLAHLGFAAVMLGFMFRDASPAPLMITLSMLHLLLGLLMSGSNIAMTTEMLGLMPDKYKAISSSICITMMMVGSALSSAISAGLLELGVLQEQWELMDVTLSHYDAVLGAFGVMVLLLVVTLGQVPSVIHPAQWSLRQY